MNFEPVKEALTIYQGSRYEHSVAVYEADKVTAAVLTAFTARMQVRSKVSDTTVLFEATTENGFLTIQVNPGVVKITIPASTSSSWTFSKGVYDLEIVSPLAEVYRIMEGSIKVRPEVTR